MTAIFEKARKLSNENQTRYYILADGTLVDVAVVAKSDSGIPITPAGTVAVTWYATRSKTANKWQIREVK